MREGEGNEVQRRERGRDDEREGKGGREGGMMRERGKGAGREGERKECITQRCTYTVHIMYLHIYYC